MTKLLETLQLEIERRAGFRIAPLSLNALAGEHIVIVGPNAAGKSTLLQMFAGVLPSRGEIKIDGVALARMNSTERAQKIAYLAQDLDVMLPFIVRDFIAFGRYPQLNRFKRLSVYDLNLIRQSAELTQTQHLLDRHLLELSGGELQRVSIAAILAQDTPIVFLDEPTNHLDPAHAAQLLNMFKMLAKNSSKLVISVVHDINLALYFATRLIALKNGELIFDGTPDSFISQNVASMLYEIPFTSAAQAGIAEKVIIPYSHFNF